MRLKPNQQAPVFTATDVHGINISLEKLRGKKIYIAFERNAGCPVCNLRMHELLKQADYLKDSNTTLLMVYESTHEKMKEYLGDSTYPFHFIADPDNRLYTMYGVELSMGKVLKSLFNGLMQKVRAGTKLFARLMKQDGNLTRIPAEFIIDEHGKLLLAHYGRFVGDHLPIDTIKTSVRNGKLVAQF